MSYKKKLLKKNAEDDLLTPGRALIKAGCISFSLVFIPIVILLSAVKADETLQTTPFFIILGIVLGIFYGIYKAVSLKRKIDKK